MFGTLPNLSSSVLKYCPLVTEQCVSRPRRAAKGRLWICAGDKRQKLEEQVVSTNKVAFEVVLRPQYFIIALFVSIFTMLSTIGRP